MANQVKISGERGSYDVTVNGKIVASIAGSHGEFYLTTYGRWENGVWIAERFIARFKYRNALASAKHFAKWAFTQVTAEQAADLSASGMPSPMHWAEARGYVSYNVLKARKAAGRLAATA